MNQVANQVSNQLGNQPYKWIWMQSFWTTFHWTNTSHAMLPFLVACATCLKPHKSSNASLLVACAKCLNSNESSCASLLVVCAKCLKPQESSSASLLVARAKCLKPQESSCASKVARAKCLSSAKEVSKHLPAYPSQLSVLIWVQDWLVGFILMR